MHRTTVKLPDELAARLRHGSERRGRTVPELTRDTIDLYLRGSDGQGKRHLLAAAAGRGGHRDISERVGEILSKELGASRS